MPAAIPATARGTFAGFDPKKAGVLARTTSPSIRKFSERWCPSTLTAQRSPPPSREPAGVPKKVTLYFSGSRLVGAFSNSASTASSDITRVASS